MATVKFKFVINKQANHYFFVQNLSEWHFSCRPAYNNLWFEKVGPLSKEEQSALKDFKKIRQNFRDSKSIFEHSFFKTKDPYQSLSEKVKPKESERVKQTINLFENKFEKIYKEDLTPLKKWAKILTKEANDMAHNQEIIEKLGIFYKNPMKTDKVVTCYLLLNPREMNLGGGANIDNKSITCEISHFSSDYTGYVNAHLWHETTHLLFENSFFIPFLKKYFIKDVEKVSMFKELINSSFFPRGILGKTIFKQKLSKELYYRYPLREEQSKKIYKLSQEYLDKKKTVDRVYLDNVSSYLKTH